MDTRTGQFQKQADAMLLRCKELDANDKWLAASNTAREAYNGIKWDGTFEEFKKSFDDYLKASEAEQKAYKEYIRLATAKTLPAEEFKLLLR